MSGRIVKDLEWVKKRLETKLKLLKDPNTSKEVPNVAFAYFKPEEYSKHQPSVC